LMLFFIFFFVVVLFFGGAGRGQAADEPAPDFRYLVVPLRSLTSA